MVNASTYVAAGYLCQYLDNTIFFRCPWLNINLSTPKIIRYLSLVEVPDFLTCLVDNACIRSEITLLLDSI